MSRHKSKAKSFSSKLRDGLTSIKKNMKSAQTGKRSGMVPKRKTRPW